MVREAITRPRRARTLAAMQASLVIPTRNRARVLERTLAALTCQQGAAFEVVGELVHHRGELPGLLAGGDRRAVDRREGAAVAVERDAQAVAGDDVGADRRQGVVHALAVGLLDQRRQRVLDGEPGGEQGGPLARQQRELVHRQAAARLHACEPARTIGGSAGLLAEVDDLDRMQAALAQRAACGAARVGLDHAGARRALEVEGAIAEGAHDKWLRRGSRAAARRRWSARWRRGAGRPRAGCACRRRARGRAGGPRPWE